MAVRRPKTVAFDVNETLFALDPLRDRLAALGPDRPYLAAAAAGELALVAVHPWDVHGAQRAGLVGAWVNRDGHRHPGIFEPPDVEGSSLTEVVAALLAANGDRE